LKRRFFKIALVILASLVLVAFAFNGYPTVTKTDRAYIDSFLTEWKVSAQPDSIHSSFDKEIDFISTIQDSVLQSIRHDMIKYNQVGDCKIYYTGRKGSCYDRAIFMEKIFSSYGFPIRHLYLYFNSDSTPIATFDIFNKGLTSHAMLEVKTKNGWILVGTNGNWLALDQEKNPLKIQQVREVLKKGSFTPYKKTNIGITFYETFQIPSNFKVIYGVYSRHGEFLQSPIEKGLKGIGVPSFVPDYNLRMLLYNF
jgi:hypothetical protein